MSQALPCWNLSTHLTKSSLLSPSKTSPVMPCSIPIHRAGPTILDIPSLTDQDAADSAIDELPIPPPLLCLPLPGVLPLPLPMRFAESCSEYRDFPTIDTNPSLSSLPVSDLHLLRPPNPGSLCHTRITESGPGHSPRQVSPANLTSLLTLVENDPHVLAFSYSPHPSFYRLVWVVLQVVQESPFPNRSGEG